MSKTKQVLVDATSNAYLLNRYIAYVVWKKHDRSHGIKYNNRIVEEKRYLEIQWKNIKTDLLGIFKRPSFYAPRIALSLIAFWFILTRQYIHATTISFMGDVAFDAGSGSGTNGNQSAVTWTHTVTGTNTCIVISTCTLNGTTSAKYNTASMTNAISAGTPRTQDQIFYLAGVATGAHTAEVDTTSAGPLCGCAISMTNVNQSSTIGATNSATSGSTIALTTTTNGSMRLDHCSIDNETASTPLATLSSGTKQATGTGGVNQFNEYTTGYTNPQATAGANTYTWTLSNATRFSFMSIEVKPTGGAVAPTFNTFKTLLGVGNI